MVPDGWENHRLSECAEEITSGGTPKIGRLDYYGGDIPFLKIDDLTTNQGMYLRSASTSITEKALLETPAKLYPENTVLLTMYGTIGTVGITQVPMAANQAIAAFIRLKGVTSDFLAYLLSHEAQALARKAGQTTQSNINGRILKAHEVLLPPLPEQRKIAAILSSVDDAIEKTQAVIDQVQVVKRGLMQELLTRGLPGRHTRFKQTEIGTIPVAWEVQRLGDVTSIPTGQVNPTEEPYGSFPLIAPNHIESKTGNLLRIETAAEQRAISGKYPFEPGDVLYSKIRPYLEKAVVATLRGLCSADMYPLRPRDGIESKYLLQNLLSKRFTDFADSLSTRTGIPKINRGQLGGYLLAIPSPGEQLQIARIIEDLDRRFRAESSVKEQLASTKSAMMSVLLTGELRVTPDTKVA